MPDSSQRHGTTQRLARLAPWILIGGLVLFYAASNWAWLVENVTSTGWDKPRHLAHSLQYADMLSPVSIRSLFGMMVSDPIRPPLFPASAAIMYKLFGTSADIATMVNVIYLGIALAATYGIGRRWGGRWQGVVGVLLLACFPMFYAMSRYFYLEFALAAMVSLMVYLLLETEAFRRPWVSLLFGLTLGMGLLTKRTFVVFAAGPIIAVVLTSGLVPMAWERLRQRPRIHWKKALLATLAGLVLALIWSLPNWEALQSLILGYSLFFIWWALAALAFYFVTLPSAPLANALSAVFLAGTLASTWYLARIEFLERVALYGYGIDDPRDRAYRLDRLDTYFYYLFKMVNEHLSIVLAVTFAVVLLAAVVVLVKRRGSIGRALQGVKQEGWAVLAWFGGAYALLTLSIYRETRAFTPTLPALSLVFGAALFTLPWKRVRWGVVALVVVFGLVQFSALTFEPIYKLLPPQALTLPVWGRVHSFAQGVYIQLPDEDATDAGYWIEPDILQRMEAYRESMGQDTASLGLLVNTSQINAGPFTYLILSEYPLLRVESLIDGLGEAPDLSRLFAHDYVAVKAENESMNSGEQELVDAILASPPYLFDQAFELAATYTLPDGGTVALFRQRARLPDGYPVSYVDSLAESFSQRTMAGDAILLAPPELAGPFVSNYTGTAEITLVPATEEELSDVAARYERLYLVLGDEDAGQTPESALAWLNENAFRAAHEWSDSLQVITYATEGGTPPEAPAVAMDAALGEEIILTGYALHAGPWQPDRILPLSLFWRAAGETQQDYGVFVHLLDESGMPVAQSDSMPVGASRPTSGWREGEEIIDRHGLLLPDGLAAGEYALRVGMVSPASGERLLVTSTEGEEGLDSVLLEIVTVAAP